MIGQKISHYEILEKLGQGGMGVVYKARDTKLDRDVALKFLPPHLAASEQDKTRFIQEARAAAAMNHPNVCSIIDIQDFQDPQGAARMFIVMEFVDGQTLREKIGSITRRQAVDFAIQIADGLAAAHEKGIVHRDIKPENIMVRKDGICQIMDFGLAKLRTASSKINRLTKEGSTVGTAGYMSPEQVLGQDVDHRADIFSFGVLVYEMITGQLPFKGVHETALAYEIVNVDAAPMSAIDPSVDPALDTIVLDCLEKDPKERCQSIAEAARDLRRVKRESSRQRHSRVSAVRPLVAPSAISPAPSAEPLPAPPSSGRRGWIPWAVAGVFFVVAAASLVAYVSIRTSIVADPPVVFTIAPPVKGFLDSPIPAISPDGRVVTYIAHDSGGRPSLWIRSLGSSDPRPLAGTEDAAFPFWSPDNKMIAFFTPGFLKKVPITGGLPQIICEAPLGRGGSWSQNDIIVFSPDYNSGIAQVPAAGGKPVMVTRFDTARHDISHRFPCFLPDGRHFVYMKLLSNDSRSAISINSLSGNEERELFSASSNAVYTAPGYLLALRDRSLMAYKFDPEKGEVQGDGVQVMDNVGVMTNYAAGTFSASQNGTLVYMGGVSGGRQLTWFDRKGKELQRTVVSGAIYDFRLSPDQRRAIFRRIDPQTSNQDLWMLDLARNTQSRFTFEASVDDDPAWSPDGSKVYYDASPEGQRNLYVKTSTGAGSPELLLKSSADKAPFDCSSDGRFLLYGSDDPTTGSDIWVLPLTGDRKPFPYLHSAFQEIDGRFSPDGKWVAYASNESGKSEVYLQQFPISGGKWQVSVNGGSAPSWRRDGKELYYIGLDRKLMAVDIHETGSAVEVGIPAALFDVLVDNYSAPNRYDISTDGSRFLVNTSGFEFSNKPMTVVLHWPSAVSLK